MRISAFIAAFGLALATIAATFTPAHSADRGPGMFRLAQGGGPGFTFSRPRAMPPRLPDRLVKPPRFGFAPPVKCHGRHCPNKGVINLGCPGGKIRRPGRGCVSVVDDVRCPPGTKRRPGGCDKIVDVCRKGFHRRNGRCVPSVKPGGDDIVVVKPCPKGMHRHHGRCVPNVKPGGDDIVLVKPCPRGTHRHHGRCIPNIKPDDDGPVVVIDPGKGCKGKHKPRNRDCIAVVPPSAPDPQKPSGSTRSPGAPPRGVVTAAPPVPPEIRSLVTDRPHRPRELVVLVASDGADGVVTDLMRAHGIVAEERQVIALAGGTLVRFSLVDNRPLQQVLTAVAADPRVLLTQPNYSFVTSDAATTPANQLQYAPQKIRVPEAHRLARGRGIRLAILDTGIDAKHPEIAGAVAASFDSLNEGVPQAEAHGTAITGIITAHRSLQGIAPDAGVLSVRAFAGDGSGAAKSTSMALVKGIDWAFAQKARLFNLSFAGPDDPLLGRVIAEAMSKGAIFVAASGNGGPEAAPAYPAAYQGVIAVTATDDRDGLFAMAQRGAHVAVAAPGVDILAPAPGGGYDVSSGTSLATAHVTGVIALMLEQDPALSQVDVRAILEKTARSHGADVPAQTSGVGRIDAAAAANATASLRVQHPPAQVAAE
jgi:subtilisin family serine protease